MIVEAKRRQAAATSALLLSLLMAGSTFQLGTAHAQIVDDGSDKRIGQADTRVVLDLIKQHLKNFSDAKVTELRRAEGSWVCGSVNEKNRDGLYAGERGFVVDLSKASFGRVPDGPEMLNPRVAGFDEKERIRQIYFALCLN